MKAKKIVIVSNTAWSLVNFRAGLIRALVREGYKVLALAPEDDYSWRLADLGCRYVPFPIDRKGKHPGRDLLILSRLFRVFCHERPELIISYTIKPVIYASLAARFLHIPVINVITGLGTLFIKSTWVTHLAAALYRISQRKAGILFFLNREDMRDFIDRRLAPSKVMQRLPGEGIDISYFSVAVQKSSSATSAKESAVRFLMAARMLWNKGVGEYVEAGRYIRHSHPKAEFCLLGFLDVQNPGAVSRAQMDKWVAEGVITYLGVRDDVRGEICLADCVVLPSYYREGVPRSLMEAAAMGRPIITADSVGCREVVEDGINGYLCKPRDAKDLAEKMERMIALSPEERAEMGRRGREKMEREFDERIVINKYLETIRQIIPR